MSAAKCIVDTRLAPAAQQWAADAERFTLDVRVLAPAADCLNTLRSRQVGLMSAAAALPGMVARVREEVESQVFMEAHGMTYDDDPGRVCGVCMANIITRETEVPLQCGCNNVCRPCLHEYLVSKVRTRSASIARRGKGALIGRPRVVGCAACRRVGSVVSCGVVWHVRV